MQRGSVVMVGVGVLRRVDMEIRCLRGEADERGDERD
jgi:hypothetical protein